jgi:hypothetical protein
MFLGDINNTPSISSYSEILLPIYKPSTENKNQDMIYDVQKIRTKYKKHSRRFFLVTGLTLWHLRLVPKTRRELIKWLQCRYWQVLQILCHQINCHPSIDIVAADARWPMWRQPGPHGVCNEHLLLSLVPHSWHLVRQTSSTPHTWLVVSHSALTLIQNLQFSYVFLLNFCSQNI